MSPFSHYIDIDQRTKSDTGAGVVGGVSLYDDVTVPDDRYALVYLTASHITSGPSPMELALYSRFNTSLRLAVGVGSTSFGTTQDTYPGDTPGVIFLGPGDILRFAYSTPDSGAYGTIYYSVVYFKAK